jgi:dolichyl-phosphate-mannose--protein O-mannosyl transferase
MTAVTTTAPTRPPAPTPAVHAAALDEARARLSSLAPGDRLAGWLWTLAVTAVAAVLRFWRLGDPHAFVFDETYYAKDAWSLWHFGAEQEWRQGADKEILAGNIDQWTGNPAYVVHPPAGKWVIALGEAAFGFDPTGWRVAVAVLGTLSVLVLARVARRMFGSTLLGCVAGLLLALDGMHFVQSRTALLDIILMFWVLLGFACLLLDRDASRARLSAWLGRGGIGAADGYGPRLGLRPWRLAAGLCLGLACATKWNGAFFVIAFGLLSYAWDVGARRSAGLPIGRPVTVAVCAYAAVGSTVLAYLARPHTASDGTDAGSLGRMLFFAVLALASAAAAAGLARRTASPARPRMLRAALGHPGAAMSALVLVPIGVYVVTWAGWFAADPARAYNRANDTDRLLPGPLGALWDYHRQALEFHRTLREPHPYSSNPWSWPILGRPVSMFYEGPKSGEQGCEVETCSKAVLAIGTPMIWWAGMFAVLVIVVLWLGRRDWRAAAITAGVAGGYLPWFAFQERTIYSFYAVVFLPYVVLALTMCLGLVLGSRTATSTRRIWGASLAGTYLLLVLANFAYLYPILAARVIPLSEWSERMWSRSWI